MNFLSVEFLAFIIVFVLIYYAISPKYRYLVLLAGSYIFYGWVDYKILLVLILTTILTYVGGNVISNGYRKKSYMFFFLLNLIILIVFKYTNFVIDNINIVGNKMGYERIPGLKLLLPVGLSFYIFQSCTYLGDVYRKKIDVEKNFLRYAAFVAYFPTILSGPIQKARELLPQLENAKKFEFESAFKGLILFIWGAFQKVCVANNLLYIINLIYDDYESYGTPYYLVAAISFSIYIYADFASYSDMARGVSKILGIEIGRNFQNPYLATSLSEFWRKWHVSLNDWFVENIYIPLGGSKKGKIRKYCNILLVFLISGLWHGSEWHFVAWGVLNGILAVMGQVLASSKRKIYVLCGVDENVFSIRFAKRAGVFAWITLTWVFFYNGIGKSLYVIKEMLFFWPSELFVPELINICGSPVKTFVILLMVIVFVVVQISRKKEKIYYEKFREQPVVFQCMLLAVIMYVCFMTGFSTMAQLDTEFLYFQF